MDSGIPNAFGIPECTKNFDTLDLFFGRPGDDSIESKHFALGMYCGIPECTTNFDTLDLFFGRPDDESIQSKHVAMRMFRVINGCV